MAKVNLEDIRGFYSDNGIICANCFDDHNMGSLSSKDIIAEDNIDRSQALWFCDHCKKQL